MIYMCAEDVVGGGDGIFTTWGYRARAGRAVRFRRNLWP